MQKRWPRFDGEAFERACFAALRYGGTGPQLTHDFAVRDVGLRIQRLQVMDRWRLTPREFEQLAPKTWRKALEPYPVLLDMQAYQAAEAKVRNMEIEQAKGK